jgi:hypothetical protein
MAIASNSAANHHGGPTDDAIASACPFVDLPDRALSVCFAIKVTCWWSPDRVADVVAKKFGDFIYFYSIAVG